MVKRYKHSYLYWFFLDFGFYYLYIKFILSIVALNFSF